jgi:hypothetical protein
LLLLCASHRCEIIGAFNKSKELVFTHRRYIYGEIAVISDGTRVSWTVPHTTHAHSRACSLSLSVGLWSGKPDDTFGPFECWEKADYRWLTAQGPYVRACARGPPRTQLADDVIVSGDDKRPTRSFKKAVVMLTPVTGGAYYQHFIDRGWSKLMQVWYVVLYKVNTEATR